MGKSYAFSQAAVNQELFLSDLPLEAFDGYKHNLPLQLARAGIDFEGYRPELTSAADRYRKSQQVQMLSNPPSDSGLFSPDDLGPGDSSRVRLSKSNAGRPPLDPVVMFRIVFLGQITQTSDEEMSLSISSNMVTRLFVKVPPGVRISRQAIWAYREMFAKSGVCEMIMRAHVDELRKMGLVANDGPMILDGSFVEAPKQRNTREENQLIKDGRGAELWNDQPAKKRQKDVDGRWTKKNNETHFGYKIHALADATSKVMLFGATTPANVHDSRALNMVLNDQEDKGRVLYADSAYAGKELEELTRSFNVIPCFCEKGYANRPLTAEQKAKNREKSKTRCRIEHIFGHIQTVFKGSCVRSIGLVRAEAHNWLIMLGYNICRQLTLCRQLE